jgi:hypothetical protein
MRLLLAHKHENWWDITFINFLTKTTSDWYGTIHMFLESFYRLNFSPSKLVALFWSLKTYASVHIRSLLPSIAVIEFGKLKVEWGYRLLLRDINPRNWSTIKLRNKKKFKWKISDLQIKQLFLVSPDWNLLFENGQLRHFLSFTIKFNEVPAYFQLSFQDSPFWCAFQGVQGDFVLKATLYDQRWCVQDSGSWMTNFFVLWH